MAEAARRSTRVRKTVQRFVEATDEEDELALPAPPTKRARKTKKHVVDLTRSSSALNDDDGGYGEHLLGVGPTTKQATRSDNIKPMETMVIQEVITKTTQTTDEQSHSASFDFPPPSGQRKSPHGAIYEVAVAPRKARVQKIRKLAHGEHESRVTDYNPYAPPDFQDKLHRACTQRLYVLNRNHDIEYNCHTGHNDCPTETLEIAGSTGNVYTVRVSHKPSCTCPDNIYRKAICKHIVYVLHNVLKAPARLEYQNAFVYDELKQIFASAPLKPTLTVTGRERDGNRKPVEDDCPICCMEFDAAAEEIVWCKAACGNNIHEDCFNQWAKSKNGDRVTCPFCRTPWQYDVRASTSVNVEVKKVDRTNSTRTKTGYMNVADQLGYYEDI